MYASVPVDRHALAADQGVFRYSFLHLSELLRLIQAPRGDWKTPNPVEIVIFANRKIDCLPDQFIVGSRGY